MAVALRLSALIAIQMTEPSDIARALAAMRRVREKRCAVCDKPFTTRGRGVFCSAACRTKAWRERKRANAQLAQPDQKGGG